MEKKLKGHLVGFGELQYWSDYEEWIYLGGAMSYIYDNPLRHIPSKEECDKICEERSGKVKTYKINLSV